MMTDEQRLHMITEQLLIVRDNLFRGMSKSMQRLQAKSINEVLELPNFTESPQRTAAVGEDTQRAWVGLTDEQIAKEVEAELTHYWNGEYIDTTGARDQLKAFARAIEAAHGIKEKNT